MTSYVLFHGALGGAFAIVDAGDVQELRTETDVRRFFGEVDASSLDPMAIASIVGRRVTAASDSRDGLLEALSRELRGGRFVAVRLERPFGPLQALQARPLYESPARDPDARAPERPTWISLEVVHEGGARLAGTSLEVTGPNGDVRPATLDDSSRWRADDIPGRGHCRVRLTSTVPEDVPRGKAVQLLEDDAWLGPEAGASVRLAAGQHHRIVVVGGFTEVELVDSLGEPVRDAQVRGVVDERTITGTTDRKGLCKLAHPLGAAVCGIEFPQYDRSACRLLGVAEGA